MTTDRLPQAPARTTSPPLDKELLADAVEEVLARLRGARPHLEGRIDRASTYLVVQLSSSSRTRPIRCRIRRGGRRVYLVDSLSSPGVVYEVDPSGWSCSCFDFFRNGPGCKHSLAGYVLATATVPPPGTPPQPDEDGAQGDEDGDDDPEASMPQEETAREELTYAEVEAWLKAQKWITARTSPHNPHSYCLKRNANDPEMFERVATFIREKGLRYSWWGKVYTQLVANRHAHWTMGAPIPETILINRKTLDQVRKDELRNRGGAGVQWRWLHGDVDEDRAELRRQEAGQDELTGGGA